MVLYTEEQLRKAYINHLIELKETEEELNMDLGPYPELEDFRTIFEEEMENNC